jgi:hypothetical protein
MATLGLHLPYCNLYGSNANNNVHKRPRLSEKHLIAVVVHIGEIIASFDRNFEKGNTVCEVGLCEMIFLLSSCIKHQFGNGV